MKKCISVLMFLALCLFFVSVADAQNNQAYKWTGFYAGLNAGYGFGGNNGWTFESGHSAWAYTIANGRVSEPSFKPKGLIGGVQAGFDYQISDKLLIGVETDFQYSDVKDKGTSSLPALGSWYAEQTRIKQKMTWFGTTRLRFGVFPIQRLLIYGTGGLAYGRLEASSSVRYDYTGDYNLFSGSSKDTRVGHTMGGGVEFALARNLTAKAEYLYYDLGRNEVDVVTVHWTGGATNASGIFTTRGNIVRMGVNYRF